MAGKADMVDRIAELTGMPKTRVALCYDTLFELVGEALTNLYVGLGRYHRGEKLSAARFIQGYAVDRIVELSELIEEEWPGRKPGRKDRYSAERRYEQRFPRTSAELPQFMQGYTRSIESAQAILEFLERNFDVNAAIRNEILKLCRIPSH